MSPIRFVNVIRRDDDEGDGSSGLSTGAIAGIAVGGAVAIIALVILYFWRRRQLRRRQKIKRRDSDREHKQHPASSALLTSTDSEDHSFEQRSQHPEPQQQTDRQTTEPMTPAPAYSSVHNIDSSYNAHTGARESELDGMAKEINEMGASNSKSDFDFVESKRNGLDESGERREQHGSDSATEAAHELPVTDLGKQGSAASPAESEARMGEWSDHTRLSSAISEMPDSSVSGTMIGTNMTGGTVSSMGTTR